MTTVVIALYHFFDFAEFARWREPLKAELKRIGIKGTLLLTSEGINGTLAGSREAVDKLIEYITLNITRGAFEYKESLCETPPFLRTKVKLKKETISIGEQSDLNVRGEYVEPQAWNALIADPETIVIDARNAYEVEMGTFEGALNPATRNFKQLPDYVRKTLADKKDKKIATFCTGGIRCEKFTAWLKGQGYKHVYHLKGGILKYLEEIPESQSKWQGECFVFDERVAVGQGVKPSDI